MDKAGEDSNGLHSGKFEKRRWALAPFFKFTVSVNICIKMTFTQLQNHSQLLCGHFFANERPLVCQFDV